MIEQGRLKKMTSMLDRRPASSIAQKLIRHLSPLPTLCCIALINDVELLMAWEPVKNQHNFTILTKDCKKTTKKQCRNSCLAMRWDRSKSFNTKSMFQSNFQHQYLRTWSKYSRVDCPVIID